MFNSMMKSGLTPEQFIAEQVDQRKEMAEQADQRKEVAEQADQCKEITEQADQRKEITEQADQRQKASGQKGDDYDSLSNRMARIVAESKYSKSYTDQLQIPPGFDEVTKNRSDIDKANMLVMMNNIASNPSGIEVKKHQDGTSRELRGRSCDSERTIGSS
jgi:antitoxin component of MazEF toxin-antitoxin module